MSQLGYAHLHRSLGLSVFEPDRPARKASVTRVTPSADALLIPAHVAPQSDDVLAHLLFALKHEGVNLQILSQALQKIPAVSMLELIRAAPSGVYVRTACFLWEAFNGQELKDLPTITGPTVDLFDPGKYITGPGTRNAKWRVNFNGLGSLQGTNSLSGPRGIIGSVVHNIDEVTQRHDRLDRIEPERTTLWTPLGLTGFSLHYQPTENATATSDGNSRHVVFESLVRENVLYVQMRSIISDKDLRVLDPDLVGPSDKGATIGRDVAVVRYGVTQADGRPLPGWLREADKGQLMGLRPADAGRIELRIVAQFSDGSTMTRFVTIDTNSGEISPLRGRDLSQAAPRTFSEHFDGAGAGGGYL